MNIAITGSRKGISRKKVEEQLSWYTGSNNHWILGGAMGVDQYALDFLIAHNEDFEVIVPFTIENTPKSDNVRETLRKVSNRVVELNQEIKMPWVVLFQNRNIAMVDKAELVLAFPSSFKGGTRNCIDYAKLRQRTVIELDCREIQ